ncbi:MAG: NAD(P)-dependent oxidoreductase [Armatimonadota bacterium]|nr:NAD(P)-dependent oxidoreductase [Armatimonadota bacterium]
MKVLLTGGSGLVGSRLAPMVAERHEVTHFEMAEPGDGLPWIEGDLLDAEAVGEACQGMDAIVHVAAIHGAVWRQLGDHAMFETNVMGTHNVLQGAVAARARRVVFTSSISATGHGAGPPAPSLPIDEEIERGPSDLYGLSKQLGEQMCRFAAARHGLSTIILRPGFICAEDVPFERTIDFLFHMVDVRDVARAHLLALEAPEDLAQETFIITADSPLAGVEPLQFFADRIGTLEGLYPGIRELIEDGTLDPSHGREWYSIERARRVLGWEPQHGFELP